MTPSKPIDVTELMHEIRDRVRQKRLDAFAMERSDFAVALPALDNLRASISELRASIEHIADLPPQPPTLRGALGAALSQFLRRMLFWQYTQAKSFQTSAAGALDYTATGLETAFTATSRLLSRADRLERILRTAEARMLELGDRTEKVEAALSTTAETVQHLAKSHEDLSSRSDALAGELKEKDMALGTDLHSAQQSLAEIAPVIQQLQVDTTSMQQRAAQDRAVLDRVESIQGELNSLAQQMHELTAGQSTLTETTASLDRHAIQTRRKVILQEQRVTNILNSVRRTPATESAAPNGCNGTEPADDDAMAGLYLDLEDAFRGSPDEITGRLAEYLPVLKQAGVQPASDIVVDIGCGRGEWLQLLSQNGYSNKGCDLNHSMVTVCQEFSLDVVRQDGLQFLRALPENSVGAVTAFHVIEHLPLDSMLALIDGCLRALRPGGIMILETPNPQNVLVGCHNFHIDPTHRKPIPMALLQFLVEARGFCDVRPMALHPYPESMLLTEGSEVAKRFNEYFYGPQDYAVIARKA